MQRFYAGCFVAIALWSGWYWLTPIAVPIEHGVSLNVTPIEHVTLKKLTPLPHQRRAVTSSGTTASVVTVPSASSNDHMDGQAWEIAIASYLTLRANRLPTIERLQQRNELLANEQLLQACFAKLWQLDMATFDAEEEQQRMAAVLLIYDAVRWVENPLANHLKKQLIRLAQEEPPTGAIHPRKRQSYLADVAEIGAALRVVDTELLVYLNELAAWEPFAKALVAHVPYPMD